MNTVLLFCILHLSLGNNERSDQQSTVNRPMNKMDFPIDFENLGRISEGVWGVTFKAKNYHDHSLYCMKQFKHRKYVVATMRHELSILTALPLHPSVLRYHGASVVNRTRFIVTEFIDGVQLLALLPARSNKSDKRYSSNSGIEEELLWKWTEELFEGLQSLHTCVPRGIVHRDLHLGNIMVTHMSSNGNGSSGGSIKIIDFGGSKFLDETRHWGNSQPQKQHFSPERVHNMTAHALSPEKDDVWAAAVLVTELASGREMQDREGAGETGLGERVSSNPSLLQTAVSEVHHRSVRLGAVVGSILSRPDPLTRPSAADILRLHFHHSPCQAEVHRLQ